MNRVHAEAAAEFNVPPEQIYNVLADYEHGHPAILPKQYFRELTVLQGGQGSGTVFRLRMRVLGVEQLYTLAVTEPEPGRLLVETDESAGIVTTFRVEPVDVRRTSTRLVIATDSRAHTGLQGWIESWLVPIVSRRIYRQELRKLAEYLRCEVRRVCDPSYFN